MLWLMSLTGPYPGDPQQKGPGRWEDVKDPEMGRRPGWPGWAPCRHKGPHEGKQDGQRQRRKDATCQL